MFPFALPSLSFREDSKWKGLKLAVKKQNKNPHQKKKKKQSKTKATTNTYRLTTATGKLKAGRPVPLLVMPSALQERD